MPFPSADVPALVAEQQLTGLEQIADIRYETDIDFKAAASTAIGEAAFKENEASLMQAAVNMNPTIVLVGILGFISVALLVGLVIVISG